MPESTDNNPTLAIKKAQERFFAAMVDFEEIRKKAIKELDNLTTLGGYVQKGIMDLQPGNHVYFSYLKFNNFTKRDVISHAWGEVEYVSYLTERVSLTDGGIVPFSKIERCRLHKLKIVKGETA